MESYTGRAASLTVFQFPVGVKESFKLHTFSEHVEI